MNDLLRYEYASVFLGDGAHARRTALRLYLRYGIVSHVYDRRRSLASRLCPFLRTHALGQTLGDEPLCASIDRFLTALSPRTPLLFFSPAYADFVRRNDAFIGSRFLTDTKTILGVT